MYTVVRKRKIGVQVGCTLSFKDKETQCGEARGSYRRENKLLTYDKLRDRYLWDKEWTLNWLKEDGLIASEQCCGQCGSQMKWTKCSDRSDGFLWECRKVISGKKHRTERSVRQDSWFEKANLTIEEAIKFTYWWTRGLKQCQIKEQLGHGPNTAVDWDMFCREMC